MRGPKMRRCRREFFLLLHVVGILGQDAWWKPGPGVNWDWRLEGIPRASAGVEMFDTDLFDNEATDFRALQDAGIVVVCYFSAGTYEEWREDKSDFPVASLGEKLVYDGEFWGEWWININDEGVKDVMSARLDLAVDKGCDGVEPDQLEAYNYGEAVTGFEITADDQLAYNTWIAEEAHARNLSVGLKNDREQVAALEPYFDWALSTDCYDFLDCDMYIPFMAAGKAVLDAEFSVGDLSLCNDTLTSLIDFIVKDWALDERRCSCGFPETNVECESLLTGNNPTEAPSEPQDSVVGGADSGVGGEGGEEGGTPTWVIVTAIAMVVLMVMMTYGAVIWKRKIRQKKAHGVDDFNYG
eukprot:g16004.t1